MSQVQVGLGPSTVGVSKIGFLAMGVITISLYWSVSITDFSSIFIFNDQEILELISRPCYFRAIYGLISVLL